jgi:hypothetical protein
MQGLASAQRGGCVRAGAIALGAGMAQRDRADASIAPGQFEGRGPSATLDVQRSMHGACLVMHADGGMATLAPLPGAFGRERLIDGSADVEALVPLVGSPDGRATLSIGATAQLGLGVTDHTFTDPGRTSATFRLGTLSLGPAMRASYATRVVRLSAGVAIAATSLVDHSYTPVWSSDLSPSLRVAWWNTLREARGDVTAERTIAPGVAARVEFRAEGLRYDDARPVRALSQSLTFGLSLSSRRP